MVLALETVPIPLVAGRSLATVRRAAREASMTLPLWELALPPLAVLAFSKRSHPQPHPS